jgi:CRP-like cAMP-binding protein
MSDSHTPLPHSPLIESLPLEARMRLTMHGEFQSASPDQILIEQGKPHASLFYVIDGELEARREDGGQSLVLGKISAGEWMGELDLLDQSSPVCSVVATKPTRYWVMSRGAFDAFVREFPEDGVTLLHSLSLVLCRRIREVTRKLAWRNLIS